MAAVPRVPGPAQVENSSLGRILYGITSVRQVGRSRSLEFFFSPKFTRDFNRAFRLPKEFMLKFSIFFFSQVNEIGPAGVHGFRV